MIGAVSRNAFVEVESFTTVGLYHTSLLLIVVGVVISIIAFMGSIGAWTDNDVLLGMLEQKITMKAKEMIYEYSTKNRAAINEVQRKFHCCGAVNYTDWFHSKGWQNTSDVPHSCYREDFKPCEHSFNINSIYQRGCVQAIKEYLKKHMAGAGLTCIGLGIMETNNAVKSQVSLGSAGGNMAFSRFQSAASGSDSFFSPYKHQTCVTGDKVRPPQAFTSPLPFPGFSLPEEPSLLYTPWAAREDPYQIGECVKNRNLADGNECETEADLYGLVSNILEESDQTDADFAGETLSSLKSVWSPKSVREDSQQYFLSESKMQSNSAFLQNAIYPDPFGRGQRQPLNKESQQRTEFHQSFNGFDVKDQWLFPSSSADTEMYSPQTEDVQRMPCQEMALVGSPFVSKNRPDKTDYGKDDVFCGANALSDHIEGVAPSFCLPNRLNEQFFSPFCGPSSHGRMKPQRHRQFPVQEGNALASNVQALLAGEHDSFSRECQNRPMGQRDYSEHVSEQQSFAYPRISALDTQALPFKKELAGDFGEPRTPESRVKTQSPTTDYYSKEFSGPQHTEPYQPPKGFSASFSPPTPYQSKQRDNYAVSNQCAAHHSQLSQYLNQVKQSGGNGGVSGLSKMLSHSVAEFVPQHFHQMQRGVSCLTDYSQGDSPNLHSSAGSQAGLSPEGLRKGSDNGEFELQPDKSPAHTSLVGEGRSPQHFEGKIKPQTGVQREGDKSQGFLPNAYLDFLGRVYNSHKHTGRGFSANNSGKKQPSALFPYMYSVGDPRQNPYHLQLNCGGFPSRSTFPYGNSVTFMDLCNLLPDSEFSPFNPYHHDVSAEGPFPGAAPTLRSPRLVKTRCAPTSQLHYHLEECYEQWRALEKERKKTEAMLARVYPGKRVSVVSSSALPKVPPNPSRVDRLIVDQLREQARVVSLLGKMEHLSSFPLHTNIYSALDRHLEVIYMTQTRRNEEFVNSSNRQRQGTPYFGEDRDILLLAAALKDMCDSTRKCRTALWCALQMTLPQSPTSKTEEQGDSEDAPKGHALF
ncbi:meiosis-specific coiled-coil domain-containing protein MEIOC [Megalops cyprinoides]|uniref:meiosis-specific coiled-coil domain-containing protein MEIOC n=1 Tax=Megalops cyprinoides TaxID=118141 RepID=UPI001863BF40|nr:meiosis-specific coiled-coil domain-containing protein MEIOC [Megalops cyprinoides]